MAEDGQQRATEAMVRVAPYSVVLFTLTADGPDRGWKHKQAGSGTLVRLGGRPYVLTAAHVWEKYLANSDIIYIPIGPQYPDGNVKLERKLVNVSISRKSEERLPEHDPPVADICFVELAPIHVAALTPWKTFYELSIPRSARFDEDSAPQKGVYAAMGSLGTNAMGNETIEGLNATFEHQCFLLPAGEFGEGKGGRKIIFPTVSTVTRPAPPSFRGLSGGGLWWIDPSLNECQSQCIALAGLAFYQDPIGKGMAIHCYSLVEVKRSAPAHQEGEFWSPRRL